MEQMTRTFFVILLAVFIAIVFLNPSALARDVVDVTVEASSEKATESQARQEIFKEAIEKVSKQYIQQIIGEAKYNANEETIKNKIIRESGKYVLFIKNQSAEKNSNGGTRMTVAMKISLKSLQKLLLTQGLLYKISGPPKVLPLVEIQDRINGAAFLWWNQINVSNTSFLNSQLNILHASMRKDLLPKGFYVLNPVRAGFGGALPFIFRADNLPTEDELFIGDFFDAQIVISGSLLFKKSQKRAEAFEIDVRLTARHTSNGRVVGEVIRSYQTEPGPMNRVINEKTREVFPTISQDLTIQLHDAWKSGTFGSTLIRLVVNGSFNFQRLKSFKDQFLNQVTGVKTLKERKFLPGQVIFEIDSDSSADQISAAIAKTNFKDFQVRVSDQESRQIELKVETR